MRYFWVKPSDVAVYVERGAADVGIVGKDILLEQGLMFMNCWIWVLANAVWQWQVSKAQDLPQTKPFV